MLYADICVAGAGLIGLSLALELHHRGARVLVAEANAPLLQASTAAAGMLAAEDPDNPPALLAISRYSRDLYPHFLARLEQLGGLAVPLQTSLTLQEYERPHTAPATAPGSAALEAQIATLLGTNTPTRARLHLLHEHSLDPRQLASALLAAVRAAGIPILTDTPVLSTHSLPSAVRIETTSTSIEAGHFVDCRGAWALDPTIAPTIAPTITSQIDTARDSVASAQPPAYALQPVKGQMLSLAIPAGLPLDITLRTGHFYIVPRLYGPQAGRAIVGATVEHTGFDKTVHPSAIAALHAQAAALIPALAAAPIVEAWAGLRPATADLLPLLGPHPAKDRHFVATGHYRNGILLAPATAQLMADLILPGSAPAVDLSAFAPVRLLSQPVS